MDDDLFLGPLLARHVDSLDGLDPTTAKVYAPAAGGGYDLIAEALAMIEEIEASHRALHDAAVKSERRLRRAIIDRTLRAELTAVCVQPALIEAVVAMLRQTWQFDLAEVVHDELGLEAFVFGPNGRVSIRDAVLGWAGTEPAQAYLQARAPVADGPAAQAVRRTLH